MMDIDKSRWPDNVPRNPAELEAKWGSQIDSWVSIYNKVRANKEDLLQEVRKTVFKGDFCQRYVEALERCPSLPDTMTTLEALDYLGIEHKAWIRRMFCFLHDNAEGVEWMPSPINDVSPYKIQAVWQTTDIVTLTLDSVFDQTRPALMPRLKSTDANFAGYLRRAIHNAVCNYVRTKFRREKERPFDHFWTFKNKVAHMDEPVPFEEILVDHHGSDPEVQADLKIAIEKIERAVPRHKDQIMGSLREGYTLPEAIDRLTANTHEKQGVRRVLGRVLQVSMG